MGVLTYNTRRKNGMYAIIIEKTKPTHLYIANTVYYSKLGGIGKKENADTWESFEDAQLTVKSLRSQLPSRFIYAIKY